MPGIAMMGKRRSELCCDVVRGKQNTLMMLVLCLVTDFLPFAHGHAPRGTPGRSDLLILCTLTSLAYPLSAPCMRFTKSHR